MLTNFQEGKFFGGMTPQPSPDHVIATTLITVVFTLVGVLIVQGVTVWSQRTQVFRNDKASVSKITALLRDCRFFSDRALNEVKNKNTIGNYAPAYKASLEALAVALNTPSIAQALSAAELLSAFSVISTGNYALLADSLQFEKKYKEELTQVAFDRTKAAQAEMLDKAPMATFPGSGL